ncbi:potassium channel family protein, partial [Aneurinibacillus thermoaerophilus]|uniref:ion channel n=1 Tax=Aneurinibacillus thermoaerophilus TaxID=143495 RepID=UPI003D25B39A
KIIYVISVYILVFVGIALFILSEQKNYLLYSCYAALLVSHIIIFIQLLEVSINPIKSLSIGIEQDKKTENLQKSKFMVLFVFFFLLFFNLYFEVITISKLVPSAFSENDYLTLFYYNLVTFSTVGYGDVLPKNKFGIIQASIIIFSCMFYLTVFIGNLLGISSSSDTAESEGK